MSREKSLELELNYYLDHKSEFLKKYIGKYLVIKGKEVLGVYGTFEEAIKNTIQQHDLGTFLVQYCGIENNEVQTYHSRVGAPV